MKIKKPLYNIGRIVLFSALVGIPASYALSEFSNHEAKRAEIKAQKQEKIARIEEIAMKQDNNEFDNAFSFEEKEGLVRQLDYFGRLDSSDHIELVVDDLNKIYLNIWASFSNKRVSVEISENTLDTYLQRHQK